MILNMGCGGTSVEDVNIDIKKQPKRKGVFVQCDAHHLPFKSNAFNKVLSIDVLEHVACPTAYLKEAQRVLVEQGTLILGTPNAMRILNFLFIFRNGFYVPQPSGVSY